MSNKQWTALEALYNNESNMRWIYTFIQNDHFVHFIQNTVELQKYILLRVVFLTNSESVISWYFLPQFFEAVKELHKVLFPILINRTNLHILFVGQQVRKNTCQCLSTIKVKLHSLIILPKNYQFVITFSTSQHKDRRPITKVVCFLVIFW